MDQLYFNQSTVEISFYSLFFQITSLIFFNFQFYLFLKIQQSIRDPCSQGPRVIWKPVVLKTNTGQE